MNTSITSQERKVCDVEMDIISIVGKGSVKLTIFSVLVLDLKFNRIYLAQIIFEFWVVYGQYIIDVPVSEIQPIC